MIRLDGNSLAAFRGAGVAGTVQSVAGCELFGAARVPSWASPYSAAATAALKAQFPTQWPTIRDYGFAHPEIVGYMNAYAPEDAKIAYSLVEGIGTRWLVGDGTAYIDTGVKLQHLSSEVTTRFTSLIQNAGSMLGCRADGATNRFEIFCQYFGLDATVQLFGRPNNLSSEYIPNIGEVLNVNAKMTNTGMYINVNGTEASNSLVQSSGMTPGNIHIFNSNGQVDVNYIPKKAGFDFVALKSEGVELRNLRCFKLGVARSADQVYPSSKGAQSVGTLGMLDLVTGLFHPNAASSGSFTISESPA